MANVTRIKNNQITDTTITYHKIVPGTLVGSLFNANLTLNSNISIIGNLSVAGHSSSVSSTNTYVNDPLVVFNNGYTGSLTGYDIGILINRNLNNLPGYGGVNTAWIWSEAEQSFIALATTDTGGGITNLNNAGYANVKLGNLTAVGATLTNALSAPNFYGTFHGDIYSTNGVIDNFSSGNVLITDGAITGVDGQFGTLVVTNFSTGNAVITGGSIDGTPIGDNTASTGIFTDVTDTALTSGRIVIASTGGLLADDSTLTYTGGTLSASNLSTGGTLTATTGDITDLKSTTLVATNFSSGNAQITGGSLSGVSGGFDTLVVTNFSSGNAQITGGSGSFTNLHATNFDSGNVLITGGVVKGVDGQFGTLVVTNFSSGNAQITGGSGSFTNLHATNFDSGNVLITGGTITGVDGQFGTLVATNFSSGNAQITGGSARFTDLHATNFDSGNILVTGGTVSGISGQADTLVVTNFSSGNAKITGGVITNTDAQLNTAVITNFSTGNAQITGGTITGVDGQFGTLVATNFSTGNAQITGGNGSFTNLHATNFDSGNVLITGGTITGVDSQFNTLYATNFSTGNAWVTGGYADNFQIGPNIASTGKFTTLSASGQTSFIDTTNATAKDSAPVLMFGGLGVAKDVYIGGNLYVANVIASVTNTITVTDPLLYLATTSIDPYDYEIGFYSHFKGDPLNNYQHTGIVRNHATNEWTFFSNIKTEPAGSTIDFNDAGKIYDTILAGGLHLANTTPATSKTTGALIVDGGVGITGNLYANTINIDKLNIASINNTVIGNTNPSTGAFTYLTATTGFSSANVLITGGTVTGVDGQAGTFVVTDFSTGNAQITGGTITGVDGQAGTFVVTNFSTANAKITGGTITGVDGQAGTFVVTNFSTGNAHITGGDSAFGTLTTTNFSTGNAVITGGSARFTDLHATNFDTGNALITGGFVSGVDGQAGTLVVTNFSSGNAQITGGSARFTDLHATNFDTGNALITGGFVSGVDGQAGTFVVTNFSTANAKITGGTVTGVDGQAGTLVVTNFSTANAQITGGSITGLDGAFNTLYATNFSTGNAQITGGTITGVSGQLGTAVVTNFSTANALITGGTVTGVDGQAGTFVVTNFSTANAVITGGQINSTTIGDIVASTGKFTSLSASGLVYFSDITEAISSNIGSVVLAGGLAVNQQIQVGGNLVATATTASTTYDTGSIVTNGGVGIAGDVYVNQGVVVNENNGTNDFVARGVNSDTLLWARSNGTYDQVAVGDTITISSLVPGAKLQVNSSDSILLPMGTNGQRPGSSGFTDVAGMLRFSTTSNSIEWFNGTSWDSGAPPFSVIVDQQFNGDDSTTLFTLSQEATTNGVIVSINGVVQIPTLAYAVGGINNTDLVFTEAPATGDVIDVRIITSAQTVAHLGSTNGYNQVKLQSTSIDLYTGSSSSTNTVSWNSTGAQVSKIPGTTIASSGVATTIDSFDKSVYRTAKYIVQATCSGNYHAQEALVIHDGSTATMILGTAAVTSGSLGTITTTISGSNVLLQFTASSNNTDVRIKKDYILI